MAKINLKKANKSYKKFYSISTVLGSIIILMILLLQNTYCKTSGKEGNYNLDYPIELIKLAESLSMEPIGGKKFLHNLKIYSGHGLPYAFHVCTKVPVGENRIPASVLFWCQKGKEKYLVYAEDNQKREGWWNYEVKSVISTSDLLGHNYGMKGSYGMVVYDGILGITKDLSCFSYLDNPAENGPKDVYPTYLNGFLPIIIYQESSTLVLYRYKDRWLKYIEADI
jgi:hypothetical protein